MRILVLANVPPGAVGGAEVQAWNLAVHWAAMGHSVTVAGYANEQVRCNGVEILRVWTARGTRCLRGGTYVLSTLWLLWARRAHYDVIYCRFFNEQAIVASLGKALLGLRKPLVACPESAAGDGDIEQLGRSWVGRAMLRLLGHQVDTVVAISRRIEAELRCLNMAKAKILRLPNGVTVPSPLGAQAVNRSGARRFVFVGRFVAVKCIEHLVEAAHRLRREGVRLEIRLVGDGPCRAALEKQVCDLALQDVVQFAGSLSCDGVAAELSRADVFVLCSRREGLPVALLEAMASGLPVISTSVSGAEDVVDGKVGWLLPIDDVSALCGALRAAVRADAVTLREMGARARELMQREYEMGVIATRYEELFRELVRRS